MADRLPSPDRAARASRGPSTSPPAARARRAGAWRPWRNGWSARRRPRESGPSRRHELPVVGRPRTPRPRSRRAGSRPLPRRPGRPRRRRTHPASRSMSACQTSGVRVHARLVSRERAAGPTLDQIAGDGERPADEADDRALGVERRAYEPDRLERAGQRLVRLERRIAGEVAGRPNRARRPPGPRPRRGSTPTPMPETGSMMSE